jgi:hypothetical protein
MFDLARFEVLAGVLLKIGVVLGKGGGYYTVSTAKVTDVSKAL